MLCELTGTPDQAINPRDCDNVAPDTPGEMVYNFLRGENNDINLNRISDKQLARDFKYLIDVFRHFEYEKSFTRDENNADKLMTIDDFLSETLIGYLV